MTVNQSFQNWTVISDEPGEELIFEHDQTGERVTLDQDGSMSAPVADLDRAVTGELSSELVSGGDGSSLGMELTNATPEFRFEYQEKGFIDGAYDPDWYHRDYFGDRAWRLTVTNGNNDETDLYKVTDPSDPTTYTKIASGIFGTSGVSRVDDHVVLPDGTFVVYEATDDSTNAVYTGTDLQNLSRVGQLFSSARDLGAILEPGGPIHLYTEEDSNGGGGTSKVLGHRTTPVDDLLNHTKQTDALDLTNRDWGTGDAELIKVGGTIIMFLDRYEGDDSNHIYRVAIAQSQDYFNWTITTARATNFNGGDLSVTKQGGELVGLTEQTGAGKYGIGLWRVRPLDATPTGRALSNGVNYQYQAGSVDGLNTGTSGSGATPNVNFGRLTLSTGTTSGSHVTAYKQYMENTGVPTWRENRVFSTVVSVEETDGHYIVTGAVGESNFSLQHVGFAAIDGDLVATVGDGSTNRTKTLISSFSAGAYRLTAEYIADDRAEFFVDGNWKATVTNNLPTPTSTTRAHRMFTALSKNEATTTDRKLRVFEVQTAQAAGLH